MLRCASAEANHPRVARLRALLFDPLPRPFHIRLFHHQLTTSGSVQRRFG